MQALLLIVGLLPYRGALASEPVDPTIAATSPAFESSLHRPLPAQWLWISASTSPARDRAATRYFRVEFSVRHVPRQATLYVAGPGTARALLNGRLVLDARQDGKSRISPLVASASVAAALKPGRNALSVEASSFPYSFVADFGTRLPDFAAKIVPAGEGVDAPALARSGPGWEASLDGSSWTAAALMGGLEDDRERFQFNADAGMYRWPGYDGISPFLARLPLAPQAVVDAFPGLGRFSNLESLAHSRPAALFSAEAPQGASCEELPTLMLDFGREIAGRLRVESASSFPAELEVQYGESKDEARQGPFLGPQRIVVPAGAVAYGAKSGFRYVQVRFAPSLRPARLRFLGAEAIYYPVAYRGSFESSDAELNRIWAAGAYTAHLCLQDGFWDAPKRDRARWAGDLDVAGRVALDVFGDGFLIKETLGRLAELARSPRPRHVDTIPGYSALWVASLEQYYLRTGDEAFLRQERQPLIELLDYMRGELDARGLFANERGGWLFVDWSPGLNDSGSDVREALAATQFEFYLAYRDGARLLSQLGDQAGSRNYAAVADSLKKAAERGLRGPARGTFGATWQTNSMAIFSGATDARERKAIWDVVLSTPPSQPISPYYEFYAVSAMAQAGHRREALDWIRRTWGGMLAAGLTTTPETYDEGWPKDDFHGQMQVGDAGNFFPSLSHGWSSGATAWLSEQVLGIEPLEPGYARAAIRPDLAGLSWARGSVATPHGPISVSYRDVGGFRASVELPSGILALVSLPKGPSAYVLVNGQPAESVCDEDGSRRVVPVQGPGKFELAAK